MREPTEASFLKDTAAHVMTVKRNDGLYRHVTFAKPGTNCMRFDLVTWPGYLAYTGDMGCYVFSRIADMFEFFRRENNDGLQINLGYWAEKAEARDRDGIKEYSADRFREHVRRWLDDNEASETDRSEAEDEVLSQADESHAAYSAALGFKGTDGMRFTDFWECDSTEYTYRFIWCCYALSWGIGQFDAKVTARSEEGEV